MTKGTRHGQHKPEKVMFGAMVFPETKAIGQLSASILKCSLVDIIMDGLMNAATRAGVMENGEVKPEYKETIERLATITRIELENKRKGKKNV